MVVRSPIKEIGWGEVHVSDNPIARKWFGNTSSFEAFHWHGETFTLPESSTLLLSSPYCQHQAFALGTHLGCNATSNDRGNDNNMVQNGCRGNRKQHQSGSTAKRRNRSGRGKASTGVETKLLVAGTKGGSQV